MQAEKSGEFVAQASTGAPTVSLVDIFLKAKELEKKGHDVIHFDAGEPDFAPPEPVVNATISALKQGKSRYTEARGILEAREAISEHLNTQYGCDLTPAQVLVTAGGRMALYYCFTLLPKAAKVGIFSPDWPAYRDLARYMSFHSHFFNTRLENGWEIDTEEVRQSGCDAIVLNYPNNPTGKVLDPKVVDELVQIANEKKMLIISDEVYSDYVFDDALRYRSILESPSARYLFVTSLSKSYAMTGYRAAYVVSDEKTIASLSKLNSLIMTSAPEFVQHAIVAAMGCDAYVKEKVQLVKRRRDAAVKALKRHLDAEFHIPEGSLYIFPKLSSAHGPFDSERFAMDLLEKEYVSVSPGTTFGNDFREYIRITLLQDEKRVEEGVERMARLLR